MNLTGLLDYWMGRNAFARAVQISWKHPAETEKLAPPSNSRKIRASMRQSERREVATDHTTVATSTLELQESRKKGAKIGTESTELQSY